MKKTILLNYPANTVPVSITGKKCLLDCKHCGGIYLNSMKDWSEINPGDVSGLLMLKKNTKNPDEQYIKKSVLVSGGCDTHGAVPLWEKIEILKALKDAGFRLNIHTGLIPTEKIPLIAPLADVISFDFITDDMTIQEVYGSRKPEAGRWKMDDGKWRTGRDYIKAYIALNKEADVVPHITIGVFGGKIKGEYDAIETIASLGCNRIVFLVFIPTKGSYYEKCSPPSIEDVESIFSHARNVMPEGAFGIGCMHPRGKYKYKLERLAFEYGFDSYVNPSKKFRLFLNKLKDDKNKNEEIEMIVNKECCAFS
ncbi:MAG: radical SAM protein [Candidatus Eremiobacteraeota bacterium]|nr:radical SAM protein [Candidatus Eremiobacteraeota bacterium]